MKYFDNIINDNILQNYIINGDMSIYQRKGSSGNTTIPVSSSAYALDRYKVTNNSASVVLTVSQAPVSDTERILVSSEKLYWMNITGTLVNAKTEQRIENLRQFAGKSLVCTLWVVGTVGDTITPVVLSNFGTSGSAQESVAVLNIKNASIITTGVPQKIYFEFQIPSYVGYFFGADNTSYLSVGLTHQSAGASVKYTGWQVNVGNSVVPFTLCSRNAFVERKLCERYYEKSYNDDVSALTVDAPGYLRATTFGIGNVGNHAFTISLRTQKRKSADSLVVYPVNVVNMTSMAVNAAYSTTSLTSATFVNYVSSTNSVWSGYAYSFGPGVAGAIWFHYIVDVEL